MLCNATGFRSVLQGCDLDLSKVRMHSVPGVREGRIFVSQSFSYSRHVSRMYALIDNRFS